MKMDQNLANDVLHNYQTAQSGPSNSDDLSLDNLIHQKGRILRTKLEVLTLEIQTRFAIHGRNIVRIDNEKSEIEAKVADPHLSSHYLLRDTGERNPFPDQLFQLETQRRTEDVECWKDVVLVMRDFLYVWEAHEQAKAKAIFLNNV